MHAHTRAYLLALPFACANAFASAFTYIGAHAGTHPHTYIHTLTFAVASAFASACTYIGPWGLELAWGRTYTAYKLSEV